MHHPRLAGFHSVLQLIFQNVSGLSGKYQNKFIDSNMTCLQQCLKIKSQIILFKFLLVNEWLLPARKQDSSYITIENSRVKYLLYNYRCIISCSRKEIALIKI